MRSQVAVVLLVVLAAAAACGFSGDGTMEDGVVLAADAGGPDPAPPTSDAAADGELDAPFDGMLADAPIDLGLQPSHVPAGVTFDDDPKAIDWKGFDAFQAGGMWKAVVKPSAVLGLDNYSLEGKVNWNWVPAAPEVTATRPP